MSLPLSADKNYYCVIMAGGVGSRFWPLSRKNRPKQFLDILGTGRTLIQQTFDRFIKIMPAENILVVTNSDYQALVMEQLPDIKPENILCEPMRRNTAPCIAYASYKIKKANPQAQMVVAPSDHLILNEPEFLNVIDKGLKFVTKHAFMLTIGIHPSRPETGYGYIQVNPERFDTSFNKVKTFTEKPDINMARLFLESGDFYWNSGIFFWSVSTILKSFQSFLPEVNSLFAEGEAVYNTPEEESFINNTYAKCRNISIDYGVMEKADNVYVICADFGWSDLGTWGSMYEHSKKDENGNTVSGNNTMLYETQSCIVNLPKEKLVVIQGLKDYIITESDNVLLICKKEDEQEIRHIVNDVTFKKGDFYL